MKITVNTLGTRGDIQPYIALSLGLQQAGHSVCILTHQISRPLSRSMDWMVIRCNSVPGKCWLIGFI